MGTINKKVQWVQLLISTMDEMSTMSAMTNGYNE